MFFSSEIRWFFAGEPDPGIVDWIAPSMLGRQEKPRTDEYLLLPGCTTAGVKVREGRLEIKAQTSPREAIRNNNGVRGYSESWVKWSRGLDGALAAGVESKETWISVVKRRRLRVYAIDGKVAEEAPAEKVIDGPGCQLELARLTVRPPGDTPETEWWSFCLEAFGISGESRGSLSVMAAHDSLADISEMLTLEASMSYPFWLVHLSQ